ncbi:MAG: toxin HicA [Candidatus Melainabacteria bacterium HGW-Melainabacteria-1]|nr:MAG: toxin HicA [Candidatus Melainabacteria bacterium HGW-Melainabacteria-1]
MDSLAQIIAELERSIEGAKFSRLLNICERFFGPPRISGSHHIFKTPWKGDPRINLQNSKGSKGKAKPYQVRQVINALKKLNSGDINE